MPNRKTWQGWILAGRVILGSAAAVSLLCLAPGGCSSPPSGRPSRPTAKPVAQPGTGPDARAAVMFAGLSYADAKPAINLDNPPSSSAVPITVRLAEAIPAGQDCELEVEMDSGLDLPRCVSWLAVELQSDDGQVVAKAGWHDVQASQGYGGIDAYGQGETPIYRSDPTGFSREFPVLKGRLTITRKGDLWAVAVNGAPRGKPLRLRSTLTATKAVATLGWAAGWPVRKDLKIVAVRVRPV